MVDFYIKIVGFSYECRENTSEYPCAPHRFFDSGTARARVDSTLFGCETEEESREYDIYVEEKCQIRYGSKSTQTRTTTTEETHFAGDPCHDFVTDHKDSCSSDTTLHEMSLLCARSIRSKTVLNVTTTGTQFTIV